MVSRKKQYGFSMFEIACYLLAGGFIFTVVMKLGPYYMDDRNVSAAIDGMHKGLASKDIYEVTNAEIKTSLGKFFQVSMLSSELLKQVEVERTGGKVLFKLNYEARTPFIANVDIVMRFNHEVDLAVPAASE